MIPEIERISQWNNGTEILYKCRKCGASFRILSDIEKYCHNCGEPVEWNKTKGRYLPQDLADFYHSLDYERQQTMLTLLEVGLEFYPLQHYEYLEKNYDDYNREESKDHSFVVYTPYGDTKQSIVDDNTKLYTMDVSYNSLKAPRLDIYDNKVDHYCKVCNEKMEYTVYKPAGPICVVRKCPKCGFTEMMTDEGLTVRTGKKEIMFTFFPMPTDGRIEAQEMIDEYKKELIG